MITNNNVSSYLVCVLAPYHVSTDHSDEVFGSKAVSPKCHHFMPLLCGLPLIFYFTSCSSHHIVFCLHMPKVIMVFFIPLAAWFPIATVHFYILHSYYFS